MRRRSWLLLALAAAFGACAQPLVKESSGLAAGSDGVVWTHGDGPNYGDKVQDRNLYAWNRDGTLARVVRLDVRNSDWEDMDSFLLDGKRYLLVADVGDNAARRDESRLYVVEEPLGDKAPGDKATLAWRIRFRYPDGPHDCEAVAVDMERQRVLLVTKRDPVPRIYAVPLRTAAAMETASYVGELHPIPKLSLVAMVAHPLLGRFAHQPTGMDISADGRRAVIVTYGRVYFWQRRAGESWEQALGRSSDRVATLPSVAQYEGIAFAPDGNSVYVSQEGVDGLVTLPFTE